jgi:F-type H+-transporting ATPase subunit epsilon
VSFPFRLLTPERTLIDGEAEEVSLRAEGGDLAFLTGHVPFVGEVRPSVCQVRLIDQSSRVAAVHGGLVEMSAAGCVVLAPIAELAEEIDVARARTAAGSAADDLGRQRAAARLAAAEVVAGR